MADGRDLDGLRILILEDELAISAALREFFLMSGASLVEVSPSLAGARALAEESMFDAAVLDVVLPDGETQALAVQLAQRGTGIVFHSGNPLPDDLRTLLPQAGFAQKPCDAHALVRLVASKVTSG